MTLLHRFPVVFFRAAGAVRGLPPSRRRGDADTVRARRHRHQCAPGRTHPLTHRRQRHLDRHLPFHPEIRVSLTNSSLVLLTQLDFLDVFAELIPRDKNVNVHESWVCSFIIFGIA